MMTDLGTESGKGREKSPQVTKDSIVDSRFQ